MEHRWVRRPISFSCTAVTAGPANHIETTPPVSWHTLGPRRSMKGTPRPYEALNKQRSAVTVVSAQLRAWIQPIRSHPVWCYSPQPKWKLRRKRVQTKSVDKMLSYILCWGFHWVQNGPKSGHYPMMPSPMIGFIPLWCKRIKELSSLHCWVGWGSCMDTFGNPLFHWVDPMHTGNARINLLTVRVTWMGVHLFKTSRCGRVWLPY